jgi:hypothetical protein
MVKVEVEFADYPLDTHPTVATSEQVGPISFLDPCVDLVTITAVSSPNFSPVVDFTGDVSSTINEFTVVPDICDVTYTITDVVRKDDEATNPSQVLPEDFDIDGIFDNVDDDGKITYTP